MITKDTVEKLLHEELEGSPVFPVSISVSGNNDIQVLIDNDNGISIDDCVKVSRFLEGSFDREVEDFALSVSSPGLDQPLQVHRQYAKNVGREVAVTLEEGGRIKGLLEEVSEKDITIKTREKKRIEGRKAKQWIEEKHIIAFDAIKATKVMVSFK